jgi:hypothetical protein
LGVDADATWTTEILEIGPGDRLLLVTDGVTETFGPRQELFGRAQLAALLRRERGGTLQELLGHLENALTVHRDGRALSDDLTVVAVEFNGCRAEFRASCSPQGACGHDDELPHSGQAFVHLEDVLDAMVRTVDRRAQLPPETILLLGEPETLSYDELQRTLGQLIHDEPWETREIPKPLAKTGAWFQDHLPLSEEPFIKPWMIDLAADHYSLDITRARTMLGWEPAHALRATLPKMIAALKADPLGWYRRNRREPPAWLEEENAQRQPKKG